MKNELSVKHLNFVEQYFLHNFDRTKAYMIAYPNSSPKSALEGATRLLKNPDVNQEIKIRQKRISEKNEIKRDNIIEDLNNLIQDCKNKNDRRNMLSAINLLCKMSGQFAPQQMDVQTSYKVSFGGMKSNENNTDNGDDLLDDSSGLKAV